MLRYNNNPLRPPTAGLNGRDMRRFYAVEFKSFFKSFDGIEYQSADLGVLPYVYTNKKKAIKRAADMVDRYAKFFGYQLKTNDFCDNGNNQGRIYMAELRKDSSGSRFVVSVYESFTWD